MTVSYRIREQFQQQRRGELKRLCSVLGCGTVTIRLDGLCYRQKGLRVRNGHETQHAIGLPRIRHYANKVATIITDGDISAMVSAIETVKRQADDFLMTHGTRSTAQRTLSGNRTHAGTVSSTPRDGSLPRRWATFGTFGLRSNWLWV